MKAMIHYDNGKGYEDCLIIFGDSIGELKEKAYTEIAKRGWNENYCWSEVKPNEEINH